MSTSVQKMKVSTKLGCGGLVVGNQKLAPAECMDVCVCVCVCVRAWGCPGLHAYEVIWNYDWRALERVREQCCPGAGCVCVSSR